MTYFWYPIFVYKNYIWLWFRNKKSICIFRAYCTFNYYFSIFFINSECLEWYHLLYNPPHITRLSLSVPNRPPFSVSDMIFERSLRLHYVARTPTCADHCYCSKTLRFRWYDGDQSSWEFFNKMHALLTKHFFNMV